MAARGKVCNIFCKNGITKHPIAMYNPVEIAWFFNRLNIFNKQPIKAIDQTRPNNNHRNQPSKMSKAVGVKDPAIIR